MNEPGFKPAAAAGLVWSDRLLLDAPPGVVERMALGRARTAIRASC